jgi:hypothetical protein
MSSVARRLREEARTSRRSERNTDIGTAAKAATAHARQRLGSMPIKAEKNRSLSGAAAQQTGQVCSLVRPCMNIVD